MQSLGQLQGFPSRRSAAMGGLRCRGDPVRIRRSSAQLRASTGNSSGIVDGAGAVLLGSKERGSKHGFEARAKIRAFTHIGSEPAMMLTGPVDVTEKLFERRGMKKSDIICLN